MTCAMCDTKHNCTLNAQWEKEREGVRKAQNLVRFDFCAQGLIYEMDICSMQVTAKSKCHGEKIDTKFAETVDNSRYHMSLMQVHIKFYRIRMVEMGCI